MSRILSYLTICSFCSFLACSPAEPEVESSILSSERSINPIVTLTDEMFNSLHSVVVHQAQDAIYNQAVNYTAYPLNEVLIQAFPNWKDLLLRDAVLIMRSTGGYSPQMSFADGFSGKAFLATKFSNRSAAQDPYDCWDEGGERHCDLGYFLIWTDGYYPDRPQPWGLEKLEVASFEQVFGKAIPQSSKLEIVKGFKTYKKYCIECHRVNFAGGAKGTEHVVRPVPISEKTLLFYAFKYRKNNPLSYMPDFSDILTTEQVGNIFTYLNHMHNHQNICIMEPNYGPCQEVTSGNG